MFTLFKHNPFLNGWFYRVSTETANEYAQSKGMGFAEVSAKTSDQVSAAFTTLAQRLMKKKDSEAKNWFSLLIK